MRKTFCTLVLCCVSLVTSRAALGKATADSTFDVITYFEAEIPSIIEEAQTDSKIQELGKSLPAQLQTEIGNLAHGRIVFQDPGVLTKLQDVLVHADVVFKFEDVKPVIDKIVKEIAVTDAVLFTKIEKVGYGLIRITAKIVDRATRVRTQKQIEVNLDTPGMWEAKVQDLAREIVKDIVSRKGLIRNPKIWAAVATIASAAWWAAENNNVRNDDETYGDAATTIEATRAGINAEKSVTRRDIAAGSTAVAAGALLIFSIF